jgi:hypothetical protein
MKLSIDNRHKPITCETFHEPAHNHEATIYGRYSRRRTTKQPLEEEKQDVRKEWFEVNDLVEGLGISDVGHTGTVSIQYLASRSIGWGIVLLAPGKTIETTSAAS